MIRSASFSYTLTCTLPPTLYFKCIPPNTNKFLYAAGFEYIYNL